MHKQTVCLCVKSILHYHCSKLVSYYSLFEKCPQKQSVKPKQQSQRYMYTVIIMYTVPLREIHWLNQFVLLLLFLLPPCMQNQVKAGVCLSEEMIRDALDKLWGAVTIVYPMNLPPYDPVRLKFEGNEELAGTQVKSV